MARTNRDERGGFPLVTIGNVPGFASSTPLPDLFYSSGAKNGTLMQNLVSEIRTLNQRIGCFTL
jgi:hypothetical protein